ncbi:MAG: hypothetical protein LBB74_08170 [Chitinispirillales bacterium]|jgi:hypothetical protein|nr:hypothetical protein [Chitinispirillales bacterium]
MLTKTCRGLIAGAVVALGLCLPVAADVVFDDFEDGRTDNVYGDWWYTYESGYMTPLGLAEFTVVNGAGTMVYSGINSAKKDADDSRVIAIGTNVSEAGRSDWSGVTSITFKAKGPDGLKFRFYLSTTANSSANWGKFGKLFKISGTDWATYTVNIPGDLVLDQYAPTITFDKTKVTKLEWAIKANDTVTAANASGTFAIDDVMLIGSVTTPVTPPSTADICASCVSTTFEPSTPSVLLTDFTSSPNALGYYEYSYNNDASTIKDSTDGRQGKGKSIQFTAAAAGTTDNIYVGIGINLSDETVAAPLNASTFTGIYLEYKTTGLDKVKVEVVDKTGALTPAGKDFYVYLPGTDGAWKSAAIPFTELVAPSWVTPAPAFNKANLAKIQIATNTAGTGTIAVDNIYFLGADRFPGQTVPPAATVKYALTYRVNTDNGGWVTVAGETPRFSRTDSVAVNTSGPTVTAAPSANYRFVKWDDDKTDLTRTDVATSDKVFTAIFELQKFTVTYKAGDNGDLQIDGVTGMVTEHTVTLAPGENGPTVTAVPRVNPQSRFARWSDGSVTQSRSDRVTDGNLTFTAEFEEYVAPPVIEYVKVTYIASSGGYVRVDYAKAMGFCASVDCNRFPVFADSLAPGDSITVTAVPNDGYAFFRWDDNITTATRTDKYGVNEVYAEAVFNPVPTEPIDPELQYFVLAYSAGKGGKLKEGNGDPISIIIRDVVADSAGPTITAVPDEGYGFVRWSDGVASSVRTDIAKSDSMLRAEFVSTDTAATAYRVTYVAGEGGKLRIDDNSVYVSAYDTTVASGKNAAAITAIADSGYIFVGWSGDGSNENPRYHINVRANVSDSAIFEKRFVAVASPNREIPTAPTAEVAAIAPVAIIAGELTAGPNPASAEVKFFRTGRAIKTGKLTVYDASGNLAATVNLNDKGNSGKRAVGAWNLKDSRGRQAANGSYAVKGMITTKDGTRERVSTVIAVVK